MNFSPSGVVCPGNPSPERSRTSPAAPMKKLLLPLLLASALPLAAQTTTPTGPQITITTPAINIERNLIIIGTATDNTAGTGTGTTVAGIREVYYQMEGSSKWKRARLTAKGDATTSWILDFKNKSAVGKRIYFRAVNRSGAESDIAGRRFKRGS